MSNDRPPADDRLLTTADAAAVLNLTPRQVARLAPATLKPAQKLPGARGPYLFTVAAVEALREARA